MTLDELTACPACRGNLETGFVGPPGDLRWFRKRRCRTAIGALLAERLANGLFRNVPAKRCRHCGLVLFRQRR